MNDGEAFVRSIREAPDDEARRLVYADWLDERSDPRGEYLRLGCQLSRAVIRMAELRKQLDRRWVIAVRDGRSDPCWFRLASGREIALRELRQSSVYEGLLEGLPTTEMNRRTVQGIVNAERARLSGHEPYLIPPTETPVDWNRTEPYPFGQPAEIPSIACVGRFWSLDPARDPSQDASTLTVVWFQAEFALPIDPEVWEQMAAIDWERHAQDYVY